MSDDKYVQQRIDKMLGSEGTFSLPCSSDLKTGLTTYTKLQPRDKESGQYVQAFRELALQAMNVTCIPEDEFGVNAYKLQLMHAGTERTVTLRIMYSGKDFTAKAVFDKNQRLSREGEISDIVKRTIDLLEGKQKKTPTRKIPIVAASRDIDEGKYDHLQREFED